MLARQQKYREILTKMQLPEITSQSYYANNRRWTNFVIKYS